MSNVQLTKEQQKFNAQLQKLYEKSRNEILKKETWPTDKKAADFSSKEEISPIYGVNHTGLTPLGLTANDYAAVNSRRNKNPYVGPNTRVMIDKICKHMQELTAEENALKVEVDAYGKVMENAKFADAAFLLQDGLLSQTARLSTKRLCLEQYVNFLQGTETSENHKKVVSEQMEGLKLDADIGIALNDPDVLAERGKTFDPPLQEFYCEVTPNVNFDDFTKRMLDGKTINMNEMRYAVATFDRNMSGLFGRGLKDLKTDDPNFLGKFDRIFIGGQKVSDICAEKVNDMDEIGKSNYMKCYVTAASLERKQRIECIPAGKSEADFQKVVQLHTKTNEKPPQKPWYRRLVEFLGIVKPKPNVQEEYERNIVNNPSALQISGEATVNLQRDKNALLQAVYGTLDTSSLAKTDYIRPLRGAASIAIAYLYGQHGLDFEEILDPNQHRALKSEAGGHLLRIMKDGNEKNEYQEQLKKEHSEKQKEMFALRKRRDDLLKDGNPVPQELTKQITDLENERNQLQQTIYSTASTEQHSAKKDIAEIYVSYMDRILDAPVPRHIDLTDPKAVADNLRTIYGMGYVGFDIYQEAQVAHKRDQKNAAEDRFNWGENYKERELALCLAATAYYGVYHGTGLYDLTAPGISNVSGNILAGISTDMREIINIAQNSTEKMRDMTEAGLTYEKKLSDMNNLVANNSEHIPLMKTGLLQGLDVGEIVAKSGINGLKQQLDKPVKAAPPVTQTPPQVQVRQQPPQPRQKEQIEFNKLGPQTERQPAAAPTKTEAAKPNPEKSRGTAKK